MLSQHHYHWLIELLVYWQGNVRPSELGRYTGVTRQYASRVLSSYLKRNPESLIYEPSQKYYLGTDLFSPKHITGEANEYLNWLMGCNASLVTPLPTQNIILPTRHITPSFMRPIVRALREKRRLEVDYSSIGNPNREGRIIVPHHLVKTTLRWHVRAWCEKNQDYRDFVLSRFQGTPELLQKSEKSAAEDVGWQTEVAVILAPDARFNKQQSAVIEREFGMENGRLEILTRGCLVHYLLQALNLNPNVLSAEAEAQQIMIVNKDDIAPWLFG
ncbi:MAG TPA: WYL domain-containing protein [Alcanivoracaceae bacterium]|nr:WYL domain-containing protein [Alcanivoracaceae bacterium]